MAAAVSASQNKIHQKIAAIKASDNIKRKQSVSVWLELQLEVVLAFGRFIWLFASYDQVAVKILLLMFVCLFVCLPFLCVVTPLHHLDFSLFFALMQTCFSP